jgi:hypothetical protein
LKVTGARRNCAEHRVQWIWLTPSSYGYLPSLISSVGRGGFVFANPLTLAVRRERVIFFCSWFVSEIGVLGFTAFGVFQKLILALAILRIFNFFYS